MRKVAVVTVLLLAAVLVGYPASSMAIPLSNTSITPAQWLANAGAIYGYMNSPFSVGGTSGTIESWAHKYIGGALSGDFFVYAYRLTVVSGAVDFVDITQVPAIVDAFSFYENSSGQAPTSSDFTAGEYRTGFEPDIVPSNGKPGESAYFGIISGYWPGVLPAEVYAYVTNDQTTVQVVGPAVAPIPEPGTLLLLGSGLSGIAAWGWRRSRRP